MSSYITEDLLKFTVTVFWFLECYPVLYVFTITLNLNIVVIVIKVRPKHPSTVNRYPMISRVWYTSSEIGVTFAPVFTLNRIYFPCSQMLTDQALSLLKVTVPRNNSSTESAFWAGVTVPRKVSSTKSASTSCVDAATLQVALRAGHLLGVWCLTFPHHNMVDCLWFLPSEVVACS